MSIGYVIGQMLPTLLCRSGTNDKQCHKTCITWRVRLCYLCLPLQNRVLFSFLIQFFSRQTFSIYPLSLSYSIAINKNIISRITVNADRATSTKNIECGVPMRIFNFFLVFWIANAVGAMPAPQAYLTFTEVSAAAAVFNLSTAVSRVSVKEDNKTIVATAGQP